MGVGSSSLSGEANTTWNNHSLGGARGLLTTETPSFGNRQMIIITLWLLMSSTLVCHSADDLDRLIVPFNRQICWHGRRHRPVRSLLFQPRSDDFKYDRNTEAAGWLFVGTLRGVSVSVSVYAVLVSHTALHEEVTFWMCQWMPCTAGRWLVGSDRPTAPMAAVWRG